MSKVPTTHRPVAVRYAAAQAFTIFPKAEREANSVSLVKDRGAVGGVPVKHPAFVWNPILEFQRRGGPCAAVQHHEDAVVAVDVDGGVNQPREVETRLFHHAFGSSWACLQNGGSDRGDEGLSG